MRKKVGSRKCGNVLKDVLPPVIRHDIDIQFLTQSCPDCKGITFEIIYIIARNPEYVNQRTEVAFVCSSCGKAIIKDFPRRGE